jgi:hypothetical protein
MLRILLLKESKESCCIWLACPWRLTAYRAEKREEEEERKKKAVQGRVVSAHVSRNKKGPTVRGITRKSQVRLSYFSFDLNFYFYLYEISL